MNEDLIRQVGHLEQRLDRLVRPEVGLGLSLISETVLGASAASVTFSSIPGGFRSLRLIASARSDRAAEADNVLLRFNGDSGANYDRQQLWGTSTTAAAAATRGSTSILLGICEAANARASSFSPTDANVYLYGSTSAEKFAMALSTRMGDVSADADLFIYVRSFRWRSTAAITSITLLPDLGSNFVSGSIFTLYGLL